ncbi:cation transporter [Paenarthrobacter aurescens]|uniref:Cobalt-zinc-cadmium resistance protein n=1 Tax=Paenarthrobacter aurescens TaxID=43663 RepID=A0A4Y3NC86_PAEAU|nr:cation transporter [Paenarthrobacter aurescens]MDO6145408.1 cation transporter [Paenarthrobacter aurescens]MDO6149213.1 cation transporter [Paenarthrobacter aurescens]MDO6160457.1 cation transporter [Paenarthrobacter aurescens]MDO6164316.1 cation transporter [Paenarthrobacter aurescens]GEB19564.1 cobalt-zinc-cadmium resistance protein [Paenarthrobacter aurescens]
MSQPALRAEGRALRVSLWVSAITAAGALILGVLSGTRIIVFDGAYMGIGLILSAVSLTASSASAAGPTRRFPFGRDALTPFVVLIQGIAVAATLLVAAADAVLVIRDGGAPVSAAIIAVYGAVTAAVGFLVAWWMRRAAPDSDLAGAEIAQWRAGAILSVMMVLGAGVALILQGQGLVDAALYVDPVLVLIACLILAYIPVGLIRSGLNELLEGAPSKEIDAAITEAVHAVRKQYGLQEPLIRSGKVGRKLYVEVDFVVAGSEWNIGQEDAVRRAVVAELEPLGLDVWAYVALTADPTLFE